MKKIEMKKRNKGITLIALVVTIVVTIIIASITLGTLLGDNGIIKNSQSSKETAEQQSERIAVEQATTAAMTQDRYGKLEESIFKEELDNATEGAKTNTYDDIFSVIVTFEDTKRAYEVDTETGEVTPIPYPYENVGISLSYSLEKDGKTWLQDGSEWTNDNVVVTVNFDESNSEYNDWTENKKIMYRLEKDTEWKEYNDSSKIVSERNQKVYVKVQGDENRTKVVEGETKYIDKIKPIIREIEKAGTEIEIKATDEASGVIGYAITTTNTPPSTFTSCTNTKELTEVISTANIYGRNYYLWVKDAAGNIGSNEDIITGNLPSSDLINITHKPTEWTNGNVIATASSEVTGLDIQMSKDGIDWTTVKTLTVEQNGTVYARFWDGETGTSSKSHQITNIDKIVPVITVSPENAGASKSQNVTITTEDEGGSGLSSSNSYQYYLSTSNTSQEGGEWKDYTSGQAFTIGTGLNGTYYLHIKPIKDNATNVSTTASTQVYGPYEFLNEPPTVTINPNGNSSYTKSISVTINIRDNSGTGLSTSNSYQYYLSTSSTAQIGGTWEDYTPGNPFIIGTGKSGKYYLHVKPVSDNFGNSSEMKVSEVFCFDNSAPVITITPNSTNGYTKTTSATITVSDSGGSDLNSGNSYQYYLSTSSTSQDGGSWENYSSGNSFPIGTGLSGTYYIHVKSISDNAGNSSGAKVSGAFKFDNIAPTISISQTSSNSEVTIKATLKDNESGVNAWQISTDSNLTANSSGWTNITTTSSIDVSKKVSVSGTYYVYAKDQVGNLSKQSIRIVTPTRWKFAYKGSSEPWTAPETGYYNVTLNGAAGGISVYSVNQIGSYPRLSSKGGRVNLKLYIEKGATLYVTVGGGGGSGGKTGKDTSQSYGGYNGGGNGGIGPKRYNNPQLGQYCAGGGGGATTIAVSLNGKKDGILTAYSNEATAKNYVLGAAGGGGASNHGYAAGMEYMKRDSRGGSSASDDRYRFGYGESGGDYSENTCTQAIPSNIEGSGGGGRRLDRR